MSIATAGQFRASLTAFHPLRVASVERLTTDAVAVSLTVPPALAPVFAFLPGQHVSVRAGIGGAEVRRSYSLCLSPREAARRGEIRIAVGRVDAGVMSGWFLDHLRAGEVLEVMAPTGGFTSPTVRDGLRHHAAVAAGSGITPVLSLLTSALEAGPAARATLVYGNRSASSAMFLEELLDLKNRYPSRFQLVPVMSREEQEVALHNGRLDGPTLSAILDRLLPVPSVDEWWLCGPWPMLQGARSLLEGRGAAAERVHTEVFHVDDAGAPARASLPDGHTRTDRDSPATATAATTLRVRLDGRTSVVAMPSRDESVLAATLRGRPDAPYSCTGGVCGTCRARLVAGQVRMEHTYALEPADIERGAVLTCQAQPRSDLVEIDYDS